MIINSIPLVKLDYKKTPSQLVIDLINNDNGTDFKDGELSFGKPELINKRHNSKVQVTPSSKSRYKGKATLKYNRIDIGQIPGERSKTFNVILEKTIADLIPAIDERYDLKLTVNDYLNGPLPEFSGIPNEVLTVDLEANPLSLVFINKLPLSLEAGAIQLKRVITKLLLSGLSYTAPANLYLSI